MPCPTANQATSPKPMAGKQPTVYKPTPGIEHGMPWRSADYEPTPAAVGVFEAAKAKTIPYPMLPYMGLMHTALGNELSDFMQGKESAEQALKDVEAAYTAAAKEKGFL